MTMRRTLKRTLALVLAVVLVLGMVPMTAMAVTDEAALRDAITSAGNTPTTITIDTSIPLTSTLTIPASANITLAGGGTLTATGGFEAIFVQGGATLTIDGITVTRTPGTIGRGVRSWGHLIMNSGTISGHNHPGGGAGVLTWADPSEPASVGIFDMHGGTISGNTVTEWSGGGVQAGGSTSVFNMHGGTISGNTSIAASGGGVVNFTTFNMHGGTISNNTSIFGGGVMNWSTFTMNSGTISNNEAMFGGGVENSGTFNMSGGGISNNTVTGPGGGISNSGTVTMSGGTISNNTTATEGGGVINFGVGASFTMNSGTISDNNAGNGGGGVQNSSTATFTMNNGTISNNSAFHGGGVENTGIFNMNNGAISDNSASGSLGGGGVRIGEGTFTMNGGGINNNIAPARGSNISIANDGTLSYNDGTIPSPLITIYPTPIVTDVAIYAQPTNLTYTDGQTLNLAGLVVTLTFDVGGLTQNVAFADFAANGLTADPAQGTALTIADHHGTPVVITHTANGTTRTTNTDNLTVTVAQANTWTVTFDLNGGNVGGETDDVVMSDVPDGTGVTPPSAIRQGYTLTGWTSSAPNMTPANITGDVTFTAQWTAVGGGWTPPPTPTPTPDPDPAPCCPFADVTGHWGKEYICFVFAEGLMTGTSGTTFAPNGTLSRAMVATILWRMAGEPAVAFEPVFIDVPATAPDWYRTAIIWANQNGIVLGSGGRFNPYDNITREQLAAMMFRYTEFVGGDTSVYEGFNLNQFHDRTDLSGWAESYKYWANYHGLIQGTPQNMLNPGGTATRAEAAAILMRFVGVFG